MKICDYCGSENDDTATACASCGTAEFKASNAHHEEQRPADDAPVPSFIESISDPVTLFRTFVVTSAICYVIWFLAAWGTRRDLPEDVFSVLEWAGYGAVLTLPRTVYWLLLGLWLATAIGIYNFNPQARFLYLVLSVFALATTLLGGLSAGLAIESFLLQVANLCDGAVLALAYLSPLARRFQ